MRVSVSILPPYHVSFLLQSLHGKLRKAFPQTIQPPHVPHITLVQPFHIDKIQAPKITDILEAKPHVMNNKIPLRFTKLHVYKKSYIFLCVDDEDRVLSKCKENTEKRLHQYFSMLNGCMYASKYLSKMHNFQDKGVIEEYIPHVTLCGRHMKGDFDSCLEVINNSVEFQALQNIQFTPSHAALIWYSYINNLS